MSNDGARERAAKLSASLNPQKQFEQLDISSAEAVIEWAGVLRSYIQTNNPVYLIVAFLTFVEQEKYPPIYLLKEIAEKFNQVKNSGGSLDIIFGLKAKGKGATTATHKEISSIFTNVKLYQMLILINKYQLNVEKAAELVASSHTNQMHKPLSVESLIDYYTRSKDFKEMKSKLILIDDIDLSEYDQALVRMYCVS